MPKGRLLIIEDEKDLLQLMKRGLGEAGYRVFSADDGEAGLALARRYKPDLVLLDIVLPKMDGVELCRVLRRESQVPIVFVTAKKRELDRVVGLRLGADDYVTKPFSLEELLARVEAVLRRAAPRPRAADKGPALIGRLEVDLDRHEVRVGGKSADLTAREYELLKALIEAEGKVLSRAALLRTIWDYGEDLELKTRAVDELVARLRRKLGSERRRLVTVPRFGYKLDLK